MAKNMHSELSIRTTRKLLNGVEIPVFGLGVYQAESGSECRDAVVHALEFGYRLIDTAAIYENERDVGQGIRDSGIPRSEIFVTTKLWNSDHGYDSALRAFDASLERLGLDYLDLYLIHWPVAGKRIESWRALESLLKSGRTRAIGVSNYMQHHLDELLAASETVPAVNQVEYSPYLNRQALLDYCNKRSIAVEAYSPLTQGLRLDDEPLVRVARKCGKSTAQVLIRWGLQHGLIEIPKSVNPKRIQENAMVFDFEISAGDMLVLDGLNEGLHTGWNPEEAP